MNTRCELSKKNSVVKAYLHCLERGSYSDVIKLFSSNAIVHSPLYGQVEASRFYKDLFADTQSSKITLKNVFINSDNPNSAAAHFIYAWTMKNGAVNQFECVDVFEFEPNSDKIADLTIIYDTYQTRQDFEKLSE